MRGEHLVADVTGDDLAAEGRYRLREHPDSAAGVEHHAAPEVVRAELGLGEEVVAALLGARGPGPIALVVVVAPLPAEAVLNRARVITMSRQVAQQAGNPVEERKPVAARAPERAALDLFGPVSVRLQDEIVPADRAYDKVEQAAFHLVPSFRGSTRRTLAPWRFFRSEPGSGREPARSL